MFRINIFRKVLHHRHDYKKCFHLSQLYNASEKYKAVIFDMGGVVLPSPFPMTKEYEAKKNIPPGTIWESIKNYGDKGAWPKLETGKLNAQEFGPIFSNECSTTANKEVDVTDFLDYLAKGMSHPIKEVLEAIACLKQQGFKTALLTNNWKNSDGSTLLPFDTKDFDVIVESAVEGMNKPQPPIYNLCLNKLGVSANQAIFLDDINSNLLTARSAGILAIKVEDVFLAISELEKLLQVKLSPERKGTLPVRKDMLIDACKLKEYLNSELKMELGYEPEIFQFAHGQSNPTYLIDAGPDHENIVLRKKPPGKLLPSAHAIEREYRVMKALGACGVKTPTLLSFCQDSNVVGTPFYLASQVKGNIYKNPSLPGMSRDTRSKTYNAMIDQLCQIHKVDIYKAKLHDYGKSGSFISRQVKTWSRQYRSSETHEIKYMDLLINWLPKYVSKVDAKQTVVHGDYRLDNLIFSPTGEVLSVIDWELSTLGDPLTDLAYCCLAHFIPQNFPILPGLKGVNLNELGIPSTQEIVSRYCNNMQVEKIENFDYYMAFTFFKVAAIMQGVYKRSLQGQASSAKAVKVARKITEEMADLGWNFATKEGFKLFNKLPSSSSHNITSVRKYSSLHRESTQASVIPFNHTALRQEVQQLYEKLLKFMEKEIYPREKTWNEHYTSENRWTPHPDIEALKKKAKSEGLWNLFLPLETDKDKKYGAGLTNVEYAFLCEIMGRCVYAPEIFNCSAPDTGNMEVLAMFGTEEQKSDWLIPLLEGKIRSCFAMTEPQIASSDARNIESSIEVQGDTVVLNGRKWWTSGACHPQCKVAVFMGKSNPNGPSHQQQSMVLVPMDTPGISIIRHLTVYGIDDAPAGHAEILFENVVVPKENIILEEGAGFKIAQARLGPGRIHHCMRMIGSAERSLDLMKKRVKERATFGKKLVERDSLLQDIARSRIEIDQLRLLTVMTAHMMDTVGNKKAKKEIAMIKVATPQTVCNIIDRCIQAHGAAGLSIDFPMSMFYGWSRALRLADGPDEVHIMSIAKQELQ